MSHPAPHASGTVYEAFRRTASAYGDREFLRVLPETAAAYGIESDSWTYERAAREVEVLRRTYREAGYGQGHRVALVLANRPAFFLHWLALNALGVSVVPINSE